MDSSSGQQGNKPQQQPPHRGVSSGPGVGVPGNELGVGVGANTSASSNNPNHPHNDQFMQQIMMTSTDPSLLSQNHHHHQYQQQHQQQQQQQQQHHHGHGHRQHHIPGGNQGGDPLLYQNSLLDVANMMNPAMQILPPSSTSSAVGTAMSSGASSAVASTSQSRTNMNVNVNVNAPTSNNLALHTAAAAAATVSSLLPPSATSNSYTHLSSPNHNHNQLTSKASKSSKSKANLSAKTSPSAIPSIATSTCTTLGGVRIPPVPPNASTAQQVQIAAAAAAAEAAPPKGYHGPIPGGGRKRDSTQMLDGSGGGMNNTNGMGISIGGIGGVSGGGDMTINNKTIASSSSSSATAAKRGKRSSTNQELTEEEKKQLNRDRNRQHARSTRLRKKAYVNKLKELVDGLHAERSEEARKRRVAVQQLAEIQGTRRKVITEFLQFHAGYEFDRRKWETILEDGFFLKQPLTPFRSFRTLEIEQTMEKDCRVSMGIDSVICDAASMSVMTESVGFRSSRWRHIKRDEFLCRYEGRTDNKSRQQMPGSILRQNNRMQHAISSLSSSSGSSNGNGSGSDEERKKQKEMLLNRLTTSSSSTGQNQNHGAAKKVSSSSSGGSSSLGNQAQSNNDFHDYHAQPLPDPRLDGGSTDSDSPTNASDNAVVGKHVCTDSSSSGEDEKPSKKRDSPKRNIPPNVEIHSKLGTSVKSNTKIESISTTQEDSMKRVKGAAAVTDPSVSSNSEACTTSVRSVATKSSLPPNIARTGGISHNIRPVVSDLNARLSTAPAVVLPPFAGIGKRVAPVLPAAPNRPIQPAASIPQVNNFIQPKKTTTNAPGIIISKGIVKNEAPDNGASSSLQQSVIIDPDNGTTSSDDSSIAQIQAHYHINEDDMLLTDDVLMCPFIFRTQDAVLCGALAECVMPGMLRAEFSDRNKLLQLEMVYDAMGFMQQLERASGSEGKPHIIPNSLETSFQPSTDEARVITTAKPPYLIVSVNELWTRTTKYTQMEAEEKELSILHGKRTEVGAGRRPGKPVHDYSDIAQGKPACCTNIYYDKFGRDFIAFVSSYPVANNLNETTHILHIFHQL